MKLLTGNQIGSLLAWYRIKRLFEKGVLNKQNASRAVIIKTFVTTDLQNAIADHYGVRCVETLTGFKYIGAKLAKYEREVPEQLRRAMPTLPRMKRAGFDSHTLHFTFTAEKKATDIAAPILFETRTATVR